MTIDNLTLFLAQDAAPGATGAAPGVAAAPDRPLAPDNTTSTGTLETTPAPGGTPINGGTGDGKTPPPVNGMGMLPLLLILVVAMLVLPSLMGRKEKKKRAAMMAAMAKGDKVQTVGGILGTIVEVRDEEVIVKVDENANTRLRFSRSSIQSILESKNAV